jgi:hypothetical protein
MPIKNNLRISLFLLIAALLPACSGLSLASKPPAGTPTLGNYLKGTFVNSEWTLVFKASGTFTLKGPQVDDKAAYTISGVQMTITGLGCGDQEGTYLWHNDGSILTLKAIDDPCTDRTGLLSSAMWYAQP